VRPLGPPLRIKRRTAWELAHRPRLDEIGAGLRRLAAQADEDAARQELDRALRAAVAVLPRSPYYAACLRQHGVAVGDLRGLADLTALPMLDRAAYRSAWDALPTGDLAGAVVVKSSGSTGEPVSVVREPFEQLHMWGVLGFWLTQLGLTLPPRPRIVLLDPLPSALEYSVRVRVVGDGRGALHRLSLLHPRVRERLERADPAVIFGDPVGLHWWGRVRPRARPKLLLTSAQHFAPTDRAVISDPVVNYYATTETGPLAWECLTTAGVFHVLAPDVWLESVAGELVVTRLRPTVVPLLRYRTGDRGHVARHACPCGFHGWSIHGLDGRHACAFVRPDGASVDAWQLAALFKQVALDAFQLEQTARDRFVLRALPFADEPRLLADLDEALRRLGWTARTIARAPVAPPVGAKPEPFRRSFA
jgi:phenylacetate-CoA ligase